MSLSSKDEDATKSRIRLFLASYLMIWLIKCQCHTASKHPCIALGGIWIQLKEATIDVCKCDIAIILCL